MGCLGSLYHTRKDETIAVDDTTFTVVLQKKFHLGTVWLPSMITAALDSFAVASSGVMSQTQDEAKFYCSRIETHWLLPLVKKIICT